MPVAGSGLSLHHNNNNGSFSSDFINTSLEKARNASNNAINLDFNDYNSLLSNFMQLESANVQRYIDAERANSQSIMDFNAEQAERDWNRQQTSAREAMDFNERMMNAQNKFNALEAQKGRDWSEEMSSTAFQRATDDLRAAGLNPILAVGAQASTPASSNASGTPASGVGVQGSLAQGIKAQASKGDISNLLGTISGLFTSAQTVSASIFNTDTMSATQRANANKQLVGGIIDSVAGIFGIRKLS